MHEDIMWYFINMYNFISVKIFRKTERPLDKDKRTKDKDKDNSGRGCNNCNYL